MVCTVSTDCCAKPVNESNKKKIIKIVFININVAGQYINYAANVPEAA